MNAVLFVVSLFCLAAWYLGCEFLAEYLARVSHPKQNLMRSAVAIAQTGVPLFLLAVATSLVKLGLLVAFVIVWDVGFGRLVDFLGEARHATKKVMLSMVVFLRFAGPFLAVVPILKG